MKFNTESLHETNQAFEYLTELSARNELVEVKKISPNRSLNQNNYLHLIITAFGEHFGYTVAEAKIIYKDINQETYLYEKKGRKFYLSSADLSKEDMAKTIDRFMEYSKEQGYPLPLATDKEWITQIENNIERSKYYL